MSTDEIYAGLNRIFRDIFGDEAITLRPETNAADIEDWDSVNNISVIVAVEVSFGIKFRTSELESLRNVGEMVATVEKKLRARDAVGSVGAFQ